MHTFNRGIKNHFPKRGLEWPENSENQGAANEMIKAGGAKEYFFQLCVYKTVGSLAHNAVEVKSINRVKKAIQQIYGGKVPGGLLKAKADLPSTLLDNTQQKYHSFPYF